MVRVVSVGSGSRGNAIVVDCGDTRIAVDAGFGPRILAQRLKAAGIAPQSIAACAMTHEHVDHMRGARRARLKWHWTIVSTPPTLAALRLNPAQSCVVSLAHGRSFTVGNAKITLLPVSHDAASPSAVLIEDTARGTRIGVAHDLGVIPNGLVEAFERLDILVLEANHDVGMLRAGPYPPFLQDRILSARGHLSNEQSARFARAVAHKGLRAIVLAHLSEQNNTPAIARAAVVRALRGSAFRGTLVAAGQDSMCAVGDRDGEQLSLI